MRRNRFQEYIDSLDAISSGNNRITQIMNAANVNGGTLKKMLYVAIQRGEVEETKSKTYAISERGLGLLNGWKPYKEFSKRLDSLSDENEKK